MLQQGLQLHQKESCIMTRTYTIETGQKPTEAQLKEVEETAKMPVSFDDDCPELSEAMVKEFKSSFIQRNRRCEA